MPELTVVIPTLGMADALPRVLSGLAPQLGQSAEVIVVADATAELSTLKRLVPETACGAQVIGCEIPGASAARNRGWRTARGSIVLFLGDDIVPSRRLLAEHLAWHQRYPAPEVGVLGRVDWSRDLRITPFMRWLEHGVQFDYPGIEGAEAGWGRFYTANASVKRSLLEKTGGFDEHRLPYLYEDLDLAYRMSRHGFRLLYNRAASGSHVHPTNLDSWRQRAAQLAVAEKQFVTLHPEIQPYFREKFASAMREPPARGRGRHLLGIVPRRVPWIGDRIWESADRYFRQQLAPAFLEGWEKAQPVGSTKT